MILALIILVIAVIFLAFLNVKNQKKSDIDTNKEDNQADELMPYNKKYLLTKNEWAFYKKIKPIGGQGSALLCDRPQFLSDNKNISE